MPFGLIILITGVLNVLSFYTGAGDMKNVVQKIEKIPPLLLFLGAVVVAPFTEELFFRGALLRRAGLIPSTSLFSVLHFAYGSLFEVIGAFFIGGILAITAQKTKSLLPPIIIHALYNFLALMVFLMRG